MTVTDSGLFCLGSKVKTREEPKFPILQIFPINDKMLYKEEGEDMKN